MLIIFGVDHAQRFAWSGLTNGSARNSPLLRIPSIIRGRQSAILILKTKEDKILFFT
ncbi:hypothetical protein NIES4072_69020 [Nostoc commune NIES-4072]|uniref:Uncharacterized protein n=1 Tax=Nostoc commune NIES-4072 TaxID=2005467 RepID=A0A2R5FWV1_NOSCO|nr:hypothetical protein NIES4070_69460 [Nostoc commune HK-02]GBG23190.1 hypothetical protein NIES4072_69020 [Nostoc commune NIES-4072]